MMINKMKKVLFLALIVLSLGACSIDLEDSNIAGDLEEAEEVSVNLFAMDTYMSITATGVNAQDAVDKSVEAIIELEDLISRTMEDSDIYRLNNSDGAVVVVDDLTYDILTLALDVAEKTNGAFDPTICAITDLWGIGTDAERVPSDEEIAEALKTVSYTNILLLGDNQVQLLNGAKIDLGAVGKGYAADLIVDIYDDNEITSGIISLSGNIYVYGEKEDGELWSIGVADPEVSGVYSIIIESEQTSIVTSGAYERYFEQDGVIYHHVFDSQTGYPTTENILSMTIVCESSALADMYSTALFAMGYDAAIEFAENESNIDVVIIRDDDQVYISPALEATSTLADKYTY